jgi:hypothetical protein
MAIFLSLLFLRTVQFTAYIVYYTFGLVNGYGTKIIRAAYCKSTAGIALIEVILFFAPDTLKYRARRVFPRRAFYSGRGQMPAAGSVFSGIVTRRRGRVFSVYIELKFFP